MTLPSKKILCLLSFTLLWFTSCSSKSQFGPDADYFIGLQRLSEGHEKEARTKFRRCMKKGTYECAKRSAQTLATLGTVQERNTACKNLIQAFPDEDSLLIAANQFYSADEIGTVIQITENLDFKTAPDELINLRLKALKRQNLSSFSAEVYDWFTLRPISQTHYKFYRDIYKNNLIEESKFSPKDYAIAYRIDVYRRNYLGAFSKATVLFDYFSNGKLEPRTELASDIGKAYLYGNDNWYKNAALFRQKAEEFKNQPVEFYFWFYAGRLFDQGSLYYTQAITCYQNAMEATLDENHKDNALWYMLRTRLNLSLDSTIKNIGSYAMLFSDPNYFDNFFDNLIPKLIVNGKWDSFGYILNQIDGYASDETCAKIAYIYGRLVQSGYITPSSDAQDPQIEANRAFNRALNSGTDLYYRILAAYRLGITDFTFNNKSDFTAEETPADILLKGYAYFGMPQKIYDEYLEYRNDISTDTAMIIADFLQNCGSQNQDYYTQALRIASRSANRSDRALTNKELQLVFPKDYKTEIEKWCGEYSVPEEMMFALVRSESFFDADIVSSAGAIGLTQLMETTGADIAKKLKKYEYSLTDAETNLQFGTYYLSELLRRTENSELQAFFSYNAGITRVRRWLSSSINEFGNKEEFDGDLFLETLPYAETREYGRKLVSATVMYTLLYNEDADFLKTVENLLN